MSFVYVVQHAHEFPDGSEAVKLIGVYATEEDGREAVARLTSRPGFRDHPEGFDVSRYEIGKDHWTDGFISAADAMGDEP